MNNGWPLGNTIKEGKNEKIIGLFWGYYLIDFDET